jgi:DNA polymerase I-like protein with 3'-5' exonuclease and polymerase domains
MNENALWKYNCLDCVYTREVGEELAQIVKVLQLEKVEETQQRLFYPVLTAMVRGVRIRPEVKGQLALDIQEELSHREAFLYNALGHSINPGSSKQMQALFYEDLKQQVIFKRVVSGGKSP